MEIEAKSASLDDDGDRTVLAFADAPVDPRHYVILQFTNEPSAQDTKLRLDGIHVEWSAGLQGYDLVEAIDPTADGVLVSFDEDAARQAGVDARLTVRLRETPIVGEGADNALQRFQARLQQAKRAGSCPG